MARKAITATLISMVLSLGIALSLASAFTWGTVLDPAGARDSAVHSISSFIGLPVHDVDGATVGEINDVLVDLAANQIGYAIVSMEDRNILVPWQAVTARHEDAVVTLTVDRQTLATAPAMPAEMIDQTFGREIHEHFGVTPYWTEERPTTEVAPAFEPVDPWRGLPGQPYPHRIDPPMGGA
jgi:sporulation protein YlmC with PRC-barrel domain